MDTECGIEEEVHSSYWGYEFNLRKPVPSSKLFPRESHFQYHLHELLANAGHRVEVEQGTWYADYGVRWDLGVRTKPRSFSIRRLAIAIECKVKGGSNSFAKAIGQCVLYRTVKCCHASMLAVPSDLKIPYVVEAACKDLKIHLATELDIVDKVSDIRRSQYE